MPTKKSAATSSSTSRSRVTAALRKATGVVAKATGRGEESSRSTAKTAKKSPAKKTTKKPAATKGAAKAAPAKKASAAKAAAAKSAAKPAKKAAAATKTAARKVATTKAATKKAGSKATPAKKTTPAKKAAKPAAKKTAAVKKAPAKKTAATKAAATKTSAAPKAPAAKRRTTAQQTTPAATSAAPTKKAATNTTTKKAATSASKTPAASRKLKVRDDESPWTAKELAAVREELATDVERLTHELSGFEDDIAGLIKDSGDGAGDDQADTGAKTFEREHEYSLAQNSRDLLEQSVHALERIDDGTYGICENCGNAIGKLRLQAFPRATLCLKCKAQQERR